MKGQSLYDWCIENGEWGQQILFEFGNGNNSQQFTDKSGNIKTPYDFTHTSTKKVQWTCKEGHTRILTIGSRTRKGHTIGCPYCIRHRQRVSDKNSLEAWCQNSGEHGQLIIDEWVGLDENGNHIMMNKVACSSNKKVQWTCKEGHNWVAVIYNRTRKEHPTRCPYCSGHEISDKNSLEAWCQNNNMLSRLIIEEWTGLDENQQPINMNEVTYRSAKKVYWKCKEGHTWLSKICNRTRLISACPYCNKTQTSYPEQFLYRALKQIYPNTISRGKYQGFEFDISIPEEKTCIEYSGINWHTNRLSRDKMKENLCKSYGVRFIQIYAYSRKIGTKDIFEENQIIYRANVDRSIHNQQLANIINHILKSFGHSISEIDIEKAQTEAFNFMHNIESEGCNTEDKDLLAPGI